MFDLSGRVAMVTGAGRGIGAGIAKTLAAQGAAGVVYPVSEEAGWVTGHSLVINGGGTG